MPITTAPVVPRVRKKFSIFTSAISPYGELRNSLIPSTSILTTAYAKRMSRTYFRVRRPMSNHFGSAQFRLNVLRPNFQRYSETVPTGQSQPQNAFRKRSEIPEKGDQQKHGRRVYGRHFAREEESFQIHQSGNWKPALHTGWA